MKKDLENQVCIVTGAGGGIGRAIAHRFARSGAAVVINDLNRDAASSVAKEIETLGCRTLISGHDVSDHAAAEAFVAEVHQKLGTVDVLVNNAGILRDSLLEKLSEKDWDDVIRVNLKGPFNMGQSCSRIMMQQNRGVIVNIASIAWMGNIGQTNYSAAKAGVVAMTRTWTGELAKYGIRVNAIAPGMISTQMTAGVPSQIMDRFLKRIPLRRLGAPEEVAELAHFLASDLSAYITGQVMTIDGGLTTGI